MNRGAASQAPEDSSKLTIPESLPRAGPRADLTPSSQGLREAGVNSLRLQRLTVWR